MIRILKKKSKKRKGKKKSIASSDENGAWDAQDDNRFIRGLAYSQIAELILTFRRPELESN